jgi:myo-inositol-1(or 4)-monophosphatase
MREKVLKIAREVAISAVLEAGRLAKGRFDNLLNYEEKDDYGDIVTEVDLLTDKLILNKIQNVFPDHQIDTEEFGSNNIDSDWLWLVDPLDGTNNYALGVPIFSSSIALLYKNEPILGVIYEPIVDRLFVSMINEGAFCNQKQLIMRKKDELNKANIGWIQGHKVQQEPTAVKLRQYVDINCKRMIRLWAPTLQWCMLAKGDLDGIILYNSEGGDLYSGILMVKEAGGIVIDFEGKPFEGRNQEPYLIACHPEHKMHFLTMVQNGLK